MTREQFGFSIFDFGLLVLDLGNVKNPVTGIMQPEGETQYRVLNEFSYGDSKIENPKSKIQSALDRF